MILRLALRNILGNGWRSLINMMILCVVLVGIIWMQAMYFSWIRAAETQQKDWVFAQGMLRVRSYDPFDAFSWDDSYAPVPSTLDQAVRAGEVVPVLYSPATFYPQGRMISGMVKGIPTGQKLLKFPSQYLEAEAGTFIPAVIGTSMAKSSRLQEGDVFTIRIRDAEGAFNTLDAEVVKVIQIPVPTADMNTVWVNIEDLRAIKNTPGAASHLALGDKSLASYENEDFRNIPKSEYFADLYQIRETERVQEFMMYGLLLFLAMLAIFDTQALAVFKRRKEIGTLAALGVTKEKIALLFTLEGVLYMVFATVLSLVLGFPLFWYFARYGYQIPDGYEDFGIQGFSEPIYFSYPLGLIGGTLLFVFVLTAVVSWLPTRKIARLNPVDALRGKVN